VLGVRKKPSAKKTIGSRSRDTDRDHGVDSAQETAVEDDGRGYSSNEQNRPHRRRIRPRQGDPTALSAFGSSWGPRRLRETGQKNRSGFGLFLGKPTGVGQDRVANAHSAAVARRRTHSLSDMSGIHGRHTVFARLIRRGLRAMSASTRAGWLNRWRRSRIQHLRGDIGRNREKAASDSLQRAARSWDHGRWTDHNGQQAVNFRKP